MNKDEIMHALKRPFEEKQISWRVGSTNSEKTSGIALAYIDARDVMHRLDAVFGLDWQCRYTHAETKTICEIGVRMPVECNADGIPVAGGEWIWRAGGAGDSDIEAEKGAISDAFKRAAVLFGIGQYLYSLPNQWFDLTPAGRSYKLAGTPVLPKWATPAGYDEIMAKRARQKEGTPTHAKSGVWESMTEDKQREIQCWVDMIRAALEQEDDAKVKEYLKDVTDPDEYTAMWTRFTPTEQRAIKSISPVNNVGVGK